MKLIKKDNYILKLPIFIIILSIILTIINLIFPLSNQINSIISLISILLFCFIIGIKKGLNTKEQAYKEGLKLGLINILVLYILNCLTLNFALPLKKIFYFLIICITIILGCIIGINKKRL